MNGTPSEGQHFDLPLKGDRIELLQPRAGVRIRGTVFYVDDVQILVKWDDGRSTSLRPGGDAYRVVDKSVGGDARRP